VFVATANRARFQVVEVGLQDDQRAEVLSGLAEGQQVVTTGAASLREGDPIVLAGQAGAPQGGAAGQRPAASPAR
jgi:hypothetical protein